MADDMAPQPMEGRNKNRARGILNRMSPLRIDPTRIKTTDTVPGTRGGQGVVVVGTLLPSMDIFKGWPREAIEKAVSDRLMEQFCEQSGLSPDEVTKLLPEVIKGLFVEREVAVKKLEWPRDDAEQSTKFFKSFVNELSLMASLSHPNIIEFIGFVEDMEKGDAWIITPWEGNGNVREFLQSGEWDIPERISLARIQGTARGLEYLHTYDPPICHGDLKSLNILVNSAYRAVITDFGSARLRQRIASENQSDTSGQAPVGDGASAGLTSPQVKFNPSTLDLTLTGPGFSLRWTAPEVLRDAMQDLPSDLWAIGWICWEIVTGRLPFDELNRETAVIVHTINGKLPEIRKETQLSHALMLCSLMSDCWPSDPSKRIDASTFSRKVSMLPSATPSPNTTEGQKTRSARLLVELGQWSEIQDDMAKAESHYLSAFEVATQTEDNVAKANTLLSLGRVYRGKSDWGKAEASFKQAQEIHSNMGNSGGTAMALDGLGRVYLNQSRHHEAEKAFIEAFEVTSCLGDDGGTATALDGLGNSYRAQSRYSEAEKAFNAALEIHSRVGAELGTGGTLLGLGHTYRTQARHREAEQAFSASHEIFSRIGNDLGVANALDGLGKTYRMQYKIQEAEKALTAAHEIHSRIGDDLGTANALAGLGNLYCSQSRFQEAENAFNAAYEIYARTKNDLGSAEALVGLGTTFRFQSRNQEAEKAFKASHEISSRINNGLGTAKALSGLGHIYRLQSRNQEAEKAFDAAYEICSRIGSDSHAASALQGLGEVYYAQSRYQEAEKAFNDAYAINYSIGDHLGVEKAIRSLEMLHSDKKAPFHSGL